MFMVSILPNIAKYIYIYPKLITLGPFLLPFKLEHTSKSFLNSELAFPEDGNIVAGSRRVGFESSNSLTQERDLLHDVLNTDSNHRLPCGSLPLAS